MLAYGYDWVGNRIHPPSGSNPMVYNTADQLTSWPGMRQYTYYPDGSLRHVTNAGGTSTLASYAYTPTGMLASFTDGETPSPRCYHFDALGSTVLASNGSGTVSAANTYDAWGSTLAGTGTAVPYGYVGELGYYAHTPTQGPTLTNLLQLGVRFYDSETGRFTQRDPIGYDDGPNVYAYGHNNPNSNTDPWGLKCLTPLERCLLIADMRYEYRLGKAYRDYADCIWGAAKYPPPISLVLAWRCNARFTKDEGKAVFQHEADIAQCYMDYGDK